MKTIGGNICVRNGDSLGYVWDLAAKSLLPLCDVVQICDSDSTDGTRQRIDEWAKQEPKIKVLNSPWTDPRGDATWWVNWLNWAREQLGTDYHVQLDADEVMGDGFGDIIRQAAEENRVLMCKRWNFVRDHRHLIPPGECCSPDVIRVAPTELWMPSDYPDPRGSEMMHRAERSSVEIFHVGFIREKSAFFRKSREVQRIWANSYDQRLERAEQFEGAWCDMPNVTGWWDKIQEYHGEKWPELLKPWLNERGFLTV